MSQRQCAVLLFLACLLPAWASARQPLLPLPQQIRYGNGHPGIQDLVIAFGTPPNPGDRFSAAELSAILSKRGGIHLRVAAGGASGPAIKLYRTGPASDLAQRGEHPGPDSPEAYCLPWIRWWRDSVLSCDKLN